MLVTYESSVFYTFGVPCIGCQLFRRLSGPPTIRPYNDAETLENTTSYDPVYLFNFFTDSYMSNFYEGDNNNALDPAYEGFYKAKANKQAFLEGVTYETDIIALRRTYVSGTGVSTNSTNITTAGFSGVVPGATVTISGFTGPYSGLNTTLSNNVSVYEYKTYTLNDLGHIDLEENNSTGSHSLHLNSFLLMNVSTTGPSNTGYFCTEQSNPTMFIDNPKVSVTYKITSDMSYNSFISALGAWFIKSYGSQTHVGYFTYINNSTGGIIVSDWDVSGKLLTNGGNAIRTRCFFGITSLFYNQSTVNINNKQFRNDPTQWEQRIIEQYYTTSTGSINTAELSISYSNNIPMNYLIQPMNLYWGFGGGAPSTEVQQVVSIQYDKLNVNNSNIIGGQYFVATASPVGVNPDSTKWTILGGMVDGSDQQYQYGHLYFGVVKTGYTYTGSSLGQKVGYLYLADCEIVDPLYIMLTNALMAPISTGTYIESYTQVLAEIYKWFNSQNVDHLIIDYRSNQGGFTVPAYTSCIGGNRNYCSQRWTRRDD